MNTFERTISFCKEKLKNGNKRYRRIPWDLLSYDGGGFFASPAPVDIEGVSERMSDTIFKISDTIGENLSDLEVNDEIVRIEFFDSEEDFYSKHDGVFGYYLSDPSSEFGYPRL